MFLRRGVEAMRDIKHAGKRMPDWRDYVAPFKHKFGLEIGGPSYFFRYVIPVYQSARSIDGVNFSTNTVWEGQISTSAPFAYYPGKGGKQIIAEATALPVGDGSYDFIISSNCLEHVANPLKALVEWGRTIRHGGSLLLVLPHKDFMFDHRRPVTSFAHVKADWERQTDETDLTHLDEILNLHDLSMDAGNLDRGAFHKRSLVNHENRCLHHHVFDEALIREALVFAGFEPLRYSVASNNHVALARKL